MLETKAYYKSRGFWGPIVAIIAFASQQAGLGEVDATGVVDAILYIFEIGGIAIAWLGRLRARYKLGLSDKVATASDPTPESAAGLQSSWFASLFAAALTLLLLAGCAADPEVRWAQGQVGYNDALDGLIEARAPCVDDALYPGAGPDHPLCRIDDEAARRLDIARNRANRLLEQSRQALDEGNPPGAEVYLDALEGAMQDLLLYQLTRPGDPP